MAKVKATTHFSNDGTTACGAKGHNVQRVARRWALVTCMPCHDARARAARWTVEAIVTRACAEIVLDVKAGLVPRRALSFATLHEYVDANEYGGLCDDDCPLDAGSDADATLVNRVQQLVDVWLGSGALRELEIDVNAIPRTTSKGLSTCCGAQLRRGIDNTCSMCGRTVRPYGAR